MTLTTPDRIFLTTVEVSRVVEIEREDEMGVPARKVIAQYALDLDAVIGLREGCDFPGDNEGVVQSDRAVCDFHNGEAVTVLSPYPEVLGAWVAYRRHADKTLRLRN